MSVTKHKPAQKISGGHRRKTKKVLRKKVTLSNDLKEEILPQSQSDTEYHYDTIEVNQSEVQPRNISLKKSIQMKNNRIKKNNKSQKSKLLFCDKCKTVKPLDEFSNSQFKKKNNVLCKLCIQYFQITSDKMAKLQQAFKNNGEDLDLFMNKMRETVNVDDVVGDVVGDVGDFTDDVVRNGVDESVDPNNANQEVETTKNEEVVKKDESDYNDPEVVNQFNSSTFA